MNETYFNECIELLECIFSFAHQEEYSLSVVEKRVSKSTFFQMAEKRKGVLLPYVNISSIVCEIFGESADELENLPTYKECAWAAESYCHIQKETQLTFEAIFLYIPIQKMYEYFPVYHEMDFIHIVDIFKILFKKQSVLENLIKKRHINIGYLSNETGLSYASIFSYKKRRRDIKKMSAEAACKLANIFDVRIETLLEFFN